MASWRAHALCGGATAVAFSKGFLVFVFLTMKPSSVRIAANSDI